MDFPDKSADSFFELLAELSILFYKAGDRFRIQTDQVVCNKYLTVTMRTGTDAYNRNFKRLRNSLCQIRRNHFENKRENTDLFQLLCRRKDHLSIFI